MKSKIPNQYNAVSSYFSFYGSVAFILMSGVCSLALAVQPDLTKTPGVLCSPKDPGFSGYRYPSHIPYCARNVTHDEKLKVAQMYGIPEADWINYEFDHLIPLNSGGSNDVQNIWPQPIAEARLKDLVEQQTFDGLSTGKMTQDEAIKMIWDWIHAH